MIAERQRRAEAKMTTMATVTKMARFAPLWRTLVQKVNATTNRRVDVHVYSDSPTLHIRLVVKHLANRKNQTVPETSI